MLGPDDSPGGARDRDAERPSDDELDRTAGRTWFTGGLFVGFGAAPAVGLVIYVLSRAFVEQSLAILFVLAAALLSFAVGLAYVAMARELEP